MLVGSLLCLALAVIADLQRTNRVLLEETLERMKDIQYSREPEREVEPVTPFEAVDFRAVS